MCESCQRPASNGIIVPRDSGPLTTSALEKSQKQTAQCKQEQPGAAVQGQSSQVRGPAAEAASAAPGRDQAARRPQHDPPRRSGTVGAARSLPVLHGLGSPVQAAVLSVEKSCKGPPDSPESGPRSAAFPCTQLEQFPGAQDAELNSFQGMLGFANLYLPPPPPPDNEPVELVEGVGVGGGSSLEPMPSGSSLGHSRSQGAASCVLVELRGSLAFCLLPVGQGLRKKDVDF